MSELMNATVNNQNTEAKSASSAGRVKRKRI